MSQPTTFSLQEVSELLHVAPQRLRQWEESFPLAFGDGASQGRTRYTQTDLATLLVIQRFLENGFSAEQIVQHLNGPKHARQELNGQAPIQNADSPAPAQAATEPAAHHISRQTIQPHTTSTAQSASTHSDGANTGAGNRPDTINTNEGNSRDFSSSDASSNHVNVRQPAATDAALPSVASATNDAEADTARYFPEPYAAPAVVQPFGGMLNEMLDTVANSQQSMLNIQDSIREMLGVIVQDNFNLKSENRKLRDRMLELERTLAEYQRREETRKERLEGRLRAVESTLSAMQQQLAQLVQLQRQKAKRNRFW